MAIKLKVQDADKTALSNWAIEFKVLNTLAARQKIMMDNRATDILIQNGLDPKLYAMSFNPNEDKWEAVLKPGALTVPAPGTNLQKIKGNGG